MYFTTTGIQDYSVRGPSKLDRAARRPAPGATGATGTSGGLYSQAQKELEEAKALYQSGGAYDQAFDASKRKAMAGAQASLVGMGMANVYNPQASGAAFEGENRGNWELNRTQGLAGAMSNMANLYAGRGSELYQGQLTRDMGQLSADTSIATAGIGSQPGARTKIDRGGGGGRSTSSIQSPFTNAKRMWS